ncbi:triacylglycerol lipase OBL1-like [Actinidia eriantha]|uniref:triacylglycerol lipase OBL1-like n=1 Tax=Actinidia eriantha TaxID=165200 RepID=UPI002586C5FA|nr:triacylglycerol lipase OBL1-like [Actinidia eriantha]
MACGFSGSFSSNYMLLKPEEVDIRDLFGILCSSDLEKRKSVDCPEKTTENFSRRRIIFVSISLQKFLQSVAKPMASVGTMMEMWLNLWSSNHNLGMLFLNFLRGTVVVPDKTSANYLSFVGNVDKRVELDKNIKPGDNRYYGALSMMAAKVSYENNAFIETTVRDHWKMEFLGAFDFWNDYQEKATTQAFMLRDKNVDSDMIIVAFRGTEMFDADAWCTDFDISWYELLGMGKVHGGFMKALGLKKNQGWPKEIDHEQTSHNQPHLAYYAIRQKLRDLLQTNDQAKFILTGHSLGGALSILFASVLALHEEVLLLERLEGVYTFGQPRVGDEKFGKYMKEQLEKYSIPYYRFVYSNDMVPRLPYDDSTLMFKHFGTCLYFNSFYEGKIVSEEPNKNYFSLWAMIPKGINGIWELIRSFLIPYTVGSDYEEGLVLRMMRLIGLVMAGISAHSTQDYVNTTRLGNPDVYDHLVEGKKHK